MTKYLISALLIAGSTLAAAPAMARVNVEVNLDVPGLYVQPEPVYVQPRPRYVRPAPVYVQPVPSYSRPVPVYVQPTPDYGRSEPYYYDNWRERRWHHGHRRHNRFDEGGSSYRHRDRDQDGDGVPNRFDSRPYNPRRY